MTTSDYQQLQENFEPAKLIDEVLKIHKVARVLKRNIRFIFFKIHIKFCHKSTDIIAVFNHFLNKLNILILHTEVPPLA